MNGAPQGTTYRELKTILFADVAEYARLTETNEELTHSNLCVRFSLISNLVRHHNGVIHRTEGDSVLATFASPTKALQCAVDIQTSSFEQNETLQKEENLSFRIGINCGEVIIDSGETFGNCVNITKRLESLAEPGGIVFSESLFSHVHRTLPYKYKCLGQHRLKNLHNSIKAYKVCLNQKGSYISNTTFFNCRIKKPLFPIFTYAFSTACALFFAYHIGTAQLNNNTKISFTDKISEIKPDISLRNKKNSEIVLYKSKHIEHLHENDLNLNQQSKIDESLLAQAHEKILTYEKNQEFLVNKYENQRKALDGLKRLNHKLISQQESMSARFDRIEKELSLKNILIDDYAAKNINLIEANKTLLSRLDEVISQQTLNTYENLYAEYNPVRQQIIDIIESQPQSETLNEEKQFTNCSIYSNDAVKPHSLESSKGTIREELFCAPETDENTPIPQSKLAEPETFKSDLSPKEKKVVVYAYIPKLPHQTGKHARLISKNIVELYKKALSDSSLQSYKTNFVLLSSPLNSKDFKSIDNEHCNIYGADYIASVRLNEIQTNWPMSSALVIHNCKTDSVLKRDSRYLLSDSWKDNGGLYLTPSTLDSFNSQVHSIVDLALNNIVTSEVEL